MLNTWVNTSLCILSIWSSLRSTLSSILRLLIRSLVRLSLRLRWLRLLRSTLLVSPLQVLLFLITSIMFMLLRFSTTFGFSFICKSVNITLLYNKLSHFIINHTLTWKNIFLFTLLCFKSLRLWQEFLLPQLVFLLKTLF